MPDDLRHLFRSTDRLDMPDLWDRIRESEPSRRREWRRPVTLVTALLVAAAGTTAAAIVFSRETRPAGDPHANGPLVFVAPGGSSAPGVSNLDVFAIAPDGSDIRRVTDTPAAEHVLGWSPDGSLALVVRESVESREGEFVGERDIVIMSADGEVVRPIPDCDGLCSFSLRGEAWSPDGRRLAYADGGLNGVPASIVVLDIGSGATRRLCEDEVCGHAIGELSWSPDGARIAFSEHGGGFNGPQVPSSSIHVVDLTSGRSFKLTTGGCSDEPPFRCQDDGGPAWSLDGSEIAFSRSTDLINAELMLMRADGSNVRTLDACEPPCYTPALRARWAPDGRRIAFLAGYERPRIHVVDVGAGDVVHIELCARAGECPSPSGLHWSPDGTRLGYLLTDYEQPTRNASLHTVAADGSDPRQLVDGIRDCCLAWLSEAAGMRLARAPVERSPDVPVVEPLPGSFALATDLPAAGNDDDIAIYRVRADGSGLSQLTADGRYESNPAWSPDGSQIVFGSLREGSRSRLWLMDADGANQRALAAAGPHAADPAWSPDGTRIAFGAYEGDRQTVHVLDVSASDSAFVTDIGGEPSWSPDGRSIAVASSEPDGQLNVVNLETLEERTVITLPGSVSSPAWSPDGSEIAFVWDGVGGYSDLYTVRTDGSGLRRITDGPGAGSPAWSPDGRYLAFATGTYHGSGIFVVRRDGTGLTEVIHVDARIEGLSWGPV